jgi:soluble lytic murein transglycosylase
MESMHNIIMRPKLFFAYALSATGCAFFLQTVNTEASRAIPRTAASSENVRLAIPRDLSDTTEQGRLGLDVEPIRTRAQTLEFIDTYIQYRRQSPAKVRRISTKFSASTTKFARECTKLYGESSTWSLGMSSLKDLTEGMAAFLCWQENERLNRQEVPAVDSRGASRSERQDLAQQLIEHKWEAVQGLSYQSVVGVVGLIPSYSELLKTAQNLSQKSDCVGSHVATAIAYKLEEYFPDETNVNLARKLYEYGARCRTDFAGGKAAYRLALLDIWRNKCDQVPDLMTKVETNVEASQFRPRAKYWKAYCSEVLGKKSLSREARESLLFEYPMTFHNLAANGQHAKTVDWIVKNTAPPIAFRSLIRTDLNPLLRAVEALIIRDSKDLAAELVDRNIGRIQQMEAEVRLYIAALMHKNNQALTKFRVLSALFQDVPRAVSGPTLKLFFPLWFFDIVQPESGDELDPLLVTALIRQESAFNIRAQSRVGARGLMQLMPATARMLAPVRTNKLFDPKTNIELGTKYLRKRLAQYNGDVELTLAAYNAGFARVDQWKRRYPTENRVLFIDMIPFRETRDYVATILRNYYWYTRLYGPDIALRGTRLPASVAGQIRNAESPLNKGVLPSEILSTSQVDLSPVFEAIIRAQAGAARQSPIVEPAAVLEASASALATNPTTEDEPQDSLRDNSTQIIPSESF